MHAARLLSQKRKHRLEQTRRSRLHRGFPNGDLSVSEDSPWYVDKLDERRRAFASAKNAKGITLFHMFAIITFLGVVFMVVSLFASVPGLLEIGVTAFFFSLFCLIFVRCDDGKDPGNEVDEEPLDDIVIETQADDHTKQEDSINPSDSSEHSTTTNLDESQREQIKSYLIRSNPRRIPSPCHIPYGPNFSPIAEVSEPSSCASSYLTRSYEISKLAKSQTNDSLGKTSSPIEEEQDHEISRYENENNAEISISNNNSFDTEEDSSMTADASIMTVIERKGFTNNSTINKSPDLSDLDDPSSSSEIQGLSFDNSDSQFVVDELVQLESEPTQP